jgi:hypothetical protein
MKISCWDAYNPRGSFYSVAIRQLMDNAAMEYGNCRIGSIVAA